MGNVSGLDIDQIDQLAAAFDQKAEQIEEILARLNSGLRETQWLGPDRDRFEGEFEGTIGPDLRNLERELHETASRLRQQARAQEQASRW